MAEGDSNDAAAFRRFLAAAMAAPESSERGFSDAELCDRAIELARPIGTSGDWPESVAWVDALVKALRSNSRFERAAGHFALARIHVELVRFQGRGDGR